MNLTLRTRWYRYLNEPSTEESLSMVVTLVLGLAIILNIIEVVLGSVQNIAVYMSDWIIDANYLFALIFGFEYLMRLWVSADSPHEHIEGAGKKRWQYVLSPMGLIDLFSFLPIALWMMFPQDMPGDLRILKLISMVRVLKLTRYSASLLMLARVYRENKNTLLAAGLVMLILVLISATGIFLFERERQPIAFGSIPACMWWAFVTLTTVGYGDVTPITLGGKIFGTFVMVCGVGVAAMPAGIFASTFVQLMREQEHERRVKRRATHARKRSADKTASKLSESALKHLQMTKSEQREVDYLSSEYDLTLDQAVGVVTHFRH